VEQLDEQSRYRDGCLLRDFGALAVSKAEELEDKIVSEPDA
jgi:hypothetical protein